MSALSWSEVVERTYQAFPGEDIIAIGSGALTLYAEQGGITISPPADLDGLCSRSELQRWLRHPQATADVELNREDYEDQHIPVARLTPTDPDLLRFNIRYTLGPPTHLSHSTIPREEIEVVNGVPCWRFPRLLQLKAIAHRPKDEAHLDEWLQHDLVGLGLTTQAEYDRIRRLRWFPRYPLQRGDRELFR